MDSKDLIQYLEGNFQEYHQLLARVVPEKSDTDFKPGSRLLNDLVERAADIQDEVVDYRLKKILREERPYIPKIFPDRMRFNKSRQNETLAYTVSRFLAQREELVKLLRTLPNEYWERTGVHEQEGHVSFKEFIRRMAEKDETLLNKLREALGQVG